MRDYDDLKALIELNEQLVSFGGFGVGSTDRDIELAEHEIGFPLPESYKWWLSNYGGGDVGGEEIFSLYGPDFAGLASGDIVAMYKNSRLSANKIPICHSDIDGLFYFDVDLPASPGEYVVVSAALEQKYADDFAEFLEKRIQIFSN